MDDPWGNAWSATSSTNVTEHPQRSIADIPKWNTFERDADENTVDVGVPSWSGAPDAGWTDGASNLWHAEAPTWHGWGNNTATAPTQREDDLELEPQELEDEENKDPVSHPVLPTPPQSPLPPSTSSPPPSFSSPSQPTIEDLPPSSPVPATPGSLDPFGSFESAETSHEVQSEQPPSWVSKVSTLPVEVTDEPWGHAWSGNNRMDSHGDESDSASKDEWELAQEATRRRERTVPPEFLESLITQWNELAQELIPDLKSDDSGSHSWRRGLDNVEGLSNLMDSLLPMVSLPPSVQFPKTAVAKSVKESLRLTRSYHLTRSSPMAHLYASKGSNDWEKSIRAQKAAANDEWGWDLKYELDDKSEPTDSSKEKKGGGLLSFWSRKSSNVVATTTGDSSTPSQSKLSPVLVAPTTSPKPASPAPSARSNIDILGNTISPGVKSPTATATTFATPETENDSNDSTAAQPSAVSRFFNRFSRKPPPAAANSSAGDRSSLILSANDLSLLSDMVPSTSDGSVASHRGTDSTSSLEAMLSSSIPKGRYSGSSSSKLPAPLAPPPPPPSRFSDLLSDANLASDSALDSHTSEAQLRDALTSVGLSLGGIGGGYTAVSFDLIDSPTESDPPPSLLRSPTLPSPLQPPPSTSPKMSPYTSGETQRPSRLSTPTLSPTVSSPLPPLISPPSTSHHVNLRNSTNSNSAILPPPASPRSPVNASRRSANIQRLENPLPPTPQLDDFSEFFSAPVHSQSSHYPPARSPPSSIPPPTTPFQFSPTADQSLFTPTTHPKNSSDLGDFGDFISTPLRSPSPPKVPHKGFRAVDQRPTKELLDIAASRTGRWPAPPSPLPPPLAPPPGEEPKFLIRPSNSPQQSHHDLLGDDSPTKPPRNSDVPPTSSVLTTPPPTDLVPRSAPSPFPGFPAPPPPPNSIIPQPPRSLASPPLVATPPKAPAKSGLSAQDLSFFEGL